MPTATIEVVAFNIAAMDNQTSRVSGTKADLAVVMAKGLSKSKVTIGYRLYATNTSKVKVQRLLGEDDN